MYNFSYIICYNSCITFILTFDSNSDTWFKLLGNPSSIMPGAVRFTVMRDSIIFIIMSMGTISPFDMHSRIFDASDPGLLSDESAVALNKVPRLTCTQPVSLATCSQSAALLLPGPPITHNTDGQLGFTGD